VKGSLVGGTKENPNKPSRIQPKFLSHEVFSCKNDQSEISGTNLLIFRWKRLKERNLHYSHLRKQAFKKWPLSRLRAQACDFVAPHFEVTSSNKPIPTIV